MRPSNASRSAGFTLYELMMVLAIAGVMVALAAPSMGEFMANNRMTSNANDLLTAVYRARSESVKRHTQTILCFSSDFEAKEPKCDGDGSQGWVVFADTDASGDVNDDEEVLLRHGPIPNTMTLTSLPDGNDGYVAFNNAGFARNIALGQAVLGVVMCDDRGNKATASGPEYSAARGVTISPTGRPKVTRIVDTIETLGGCP
jgi:prepilin-type N-terminal cleavage/methylation domain-containing protein